MPPRPGRALGVRDGLHVHPEQRVRGLSVGVLGEAVPHRPQRVAQAHAVPPE